VFNSVPDASVATFNGVVKDAFKDLKTSDCTLVPLPPASIGTKFSTVAKDNVEASKLQAFDKKWSESIGALSRTDAAICLPPVESLSKLSLAQAEVGRAFGADESQAFGAYTGPLLKKNSNLNQVLPLLTDAKAQAPDATTSEKLAFQRAGKKIESASKAEAQKQAMARLKARSAAAAAAKGNGAASDQPVTYGSVTEEAAARKAKFAEAEAARIAELKAKRAALDAAKAGK